MEREDWDCRYRGTELVWTAQPTGWWSRNCEGCRQGERVRRALGADGPHRVPGLAVDRRRSHLEQILRVYIQHYNGHRPHRALRLAGPDPPAGLTVVGEDRPLQGEEAAMKVSDLHQHQLHTARVEETLEDAADRMNWHQVGALPVFEGQRLVGIITERDLTAFVNRP